MEPTKQQLGYLTVEQIEEREREDSLWLACKQDMRREYNKLCKAQEQVRKEWKTKA